MLLIIFMAIGVVAFDVNRINTTMHEWGYSWEAVKSPTFHSLSGFPPRDIRSDYMSISAQNFFNITKPNTWTTVSGMWRVESKDGYASNLCLQPGITMDLNTKSIAGNMAKLTECTKDSQWLHGSDKKYFFDEDQMLLSTDPGWWTIDSLTRKLDCDLTMEGHCSNSTGFMWRAYGGLCLEATIFESAYAVMIQPCSSTLNQRWNELEVVEEQAIPVKYPKANKLHMLQNREYPEKCLAVPKDTLKRVDKTSNMVEPVLEFATLDPSKGTDMQLKNCDGSEQDWDTLTFRGPNLVHWNETHIYKDSEEVDLTSIQPSHDGTGTILQTDETCSFLSIPSSSDFWPSEEILDEHPTCIKMSPDPLKDPDVIWAKWNIAGMRYDRFSTYVGLTSGLELKATVMFQVLVTTSDSNKPKIAAEMKCGAETRDYR